MRLTFRHALLAALAILMAAPAWAIRLGPTHAVRAASGLAIDIPVEFGPAETLARVAIASENVYATLGLAFPAALRGASVVVADRGGASVIRVAGGSAPVASFTLLLELDTNAGRIVRQIPVSVLVADESPVVEKVTPGDATKAVMARVDTKKPRAAERVREEPVKSPRGTAPPSVGQPVTVPLTADEFAQRMDELNTTVGRLAAAFGSLSDQMRKDAELTAGALATIQAATATKAEPPKDFYGEYAPIGVAGVLGFLFGGLWFVGSRPRIASGSPVQVLSADGEPLEGELVRLASPSEGKALPYRIADVLTGAPRRIEVRVSAPLPAPSVRRPLDSKVTRIGPDEAARLAMDSAAGIVLVTK